MEIGPFLLDLVETMTEQEPVLIFVNGSPLVITYFSPFKTPSTIVPFLIGGGQVGSEHPERVRRAKEKIKPILDSFDNGPTLLI